MELHAFSQQKKQRSASRDKKYQQSPGYDNRFENPRKRQPRQNDERKMDRKKNGRTKDVGRKDRVPRSPYHYGEDGAARKTDKEKSHTKLMDQIMDDLVAEATDNEGQYYLDLAGNVRKVSGYVVEFAFMLQPLSNMYQHK